VLLFSCGKIVFQNSAPTLQGGLLCLVSSAQAMEAELEVTNEKNNDTILKQQGAMMRDSYNVEGLEAERTKGILNDTAAIG
jgi:hypothetical protein